MTLVDAGAALLGGPRLFPILSEAQMERIRFRGTVRDVSPGEVLIEAGDRHQRLFVVVRGGLETLRTADRATLVATIGPGQFTGEVNVLADRHAIFRTVAVAPSTIIELDRAQLRMVVELDTELGELIVRTFLLRRADLVAAGVGNIVVAGSIHSAGTHRIRQGGVPNTAWLNETVALDERRYIKTGPALSAEDLEGCGWILPRSPYLLETSLPGIFAAGDVRGGNVKRVAAAVGEGSSAISYILQHLQE
jgi:hypothetical protein